MVARKKTEPRRRPADAVRPSKLHGNLAQSILLSLKESGAAPGYHLVETDLCEKFQVSRTPVRGALRLLADHGFLEGRANRGFVLARELGDVSATSIEPPPDQSAQRLFILIARDRLSGDLPDFCSQSELVRRYDTKVQTVLKVLRQLADLGLVERRPGHGWSFLPSIDSAAAQLESYALRKVIEPAVLIQPEFKLDLAWARTIRARHEQFLHRPWRDTDAVDFFEVNADFHERLALFSGNRYFVHVMQQQNRLRRFLNYHWNYGDERVQDSVGEHLAILDALEAGQSTRASDLMRRHLESAARTSKLD